MARTKTNTGNDTKTLTASLRNRHLDKKYFVLFFRAENRTRDLSNTQLMRYLCPTDSTVIKIVVKLFNSFDTMGRNVTRQSRLCRPQFFINSYFFFNIFTCMDNFILQFLILTGVSFTA